jgi:hypothetical protein
MIFDLVECGCSDISSDKVAGNEQKPLPLIPLSSSNSDNHSQESPKIFKRLVSFIGSHRKVYFIQLIYRPEMPQYDAP